MSEIVATPGEVPRPQTESGGAGGRAGLIWPANLLAAVLLSVLSAAGAIEVTGLTAIVGSLFLVGTLVPPNLNRLRRGRSGRAVRALTRLRARSASAPGSGSSPTRSSP